MPAAAVLDIVSFLFFGVYPRLFRCSVNMSSTEECLVAIIIIIATFEST